ncbi:DUF2020 domain-containing protein [Corynebacterium aquatimens]|uniref:DUF2020 domain-containing protein n=1 Tax=Corynebacterium TaxID=1716 RepID=UPI001F2EAE64|nr:MULTISPECIES: DUF2020 domain-containing protein [Corynebacterium]QYH19081.1 DUF2020 domain-containing protein [Corynebacterium aquatimens]UIZ92069.1 DUF2020 domain-containing protein [Corynebacterium sp. CNCTC7651]
MRLTLPTLPARSAAAVCAVLLTAGLVGCSEPVLDRDAGQTTSSLAPPPPGDGLPVEALPATDRNAQDTCPYLDTEWVAQTNGQRVTGVGVDGRFDPPACQFWSYTDEPQVTVVVRRMATPNEAMAVVDWATPIAHTAPADEPEGWNGGRHGGGAVPGRIGAAYSVAKGKTAVTVFTNQEESVKAQLIAEQVIATLGL